MIGIDTNFLIDLDNPASPRHQNAYIFFDQWRKGSEDLYVYFNVFLEYQHVITDAKRFENPLSMEEARQRVAFWKNQRRIKVIYSDDLSFSTAQNWMHKFQLGRKRIADTHLATAYFCNGIDKILTSNPKDFEIFNTFELINLAYE